MLDNKKYKYVLMFFLIFQVSWDDPSLVSHVEIPVSITMKSHYTSNQPIVYLSDIAECQSYHSICDEAFGIEVVRLTTIQETVRLSKEAMLEILGREWPQAIIQFKGSSLTVSPQGVMPSQDEVKNLLRKHLPVFGRKKIDIEYINILGKKWGKDLLLVSLKKGWWKNYMHAPEKIYLQTSSGLSVPVRLRLKEKCSVFVALQNMQKGEAPYEDDFEIQWKPCRQSYVVSIPDNNILKRNIRVNEILKRSDLVSLHALKRGDRKKILFKSGSLFMEFFAVAQENGEPGDTVRFKNIKTKKIVQGKIFDDGHVEVL